MPAEILSRLSAAGLHLEVSGDTLTVSPRSSITPETRELIRTHKAGLVALLTPRRRWLIAMPDGQTFDSTFTPPATAAQVQGWYPSAEVEPVPEAIEEDAA